MTCLDYVWWISRFSPQGVKHRCHVRTWCPLMFVTWLTEIHVTERQQQTGRFQRVTARVERWWWKHRDRVVLFTLISLSVSFLPLSRKRLMGYHLHTVACGLSDLNHSDLKNLVINPERSQLGFSNFGVYLLDSWEVAPVAAIIFVYLGFAGLTTPSRDWWPIQCVPCISLFSSWETFHPPRFLDGWIDGWVKGLEARKTWMSFGFKCLFIVLNAKMMLKDHTVHYNPMWGKTVFPDIFEKKAAFDTIG